MAKESFGPSSQTAEKVLLVLEYLITQGQPMKLNEMAAQLDMNITTLYRFLSTLQKTGYVYQQESGKYSPSYKICQLSNQILAQRNISGILHSYVIEASVLFQESAHIAQREQNRIVYTDNVDPPFQPFITHQYIGKTAQLHCTGIGKLFLSDVPEEQLVDLIETLDLRRYTDHTFVEKEALLEELSRIRCCGFAYDNEECEDGMRCIAVPIRDYTGKIIAGLSVSGLTSRLTDEVISSKLARLKIISRKASAEFGWIDNSPEDVKQAGK